MTVFAPRVAVTCRHAARQGATVVLVTCTRGELGEIVAPELAGLRGMPTPMG
jgi:N-acetyl-1-D-myo-inositol-2-amino-2-deoxy-alpha-D-glucopyranoside deacetylase